MRIRTKGGKPFSDMISVILSSLSGFAAVFIFILAVGWLMTKIDISEQIKSLILSLGLCIGAFAGGFIASHRRKQSGLLMGILCGLVMFGIIFVISYLFAGAAGGFKASTKLIITLISAGAGGIAGVNTHGRWFRLK